MVRVEPLKDIESFCGIVEVAHLVTVVGNELQDLERLGTRFHIDVQFPGFPMNIVGIVTLPCHS